jgi:VIT1/CCC1 family predicted Fe2+/Mn2+ transporter
VRPLNRDALLPAALGLADGILNALTLASGHLVGARSSSVTVGLAVRVSIAAFVTAGFAVFVAEYADARGTLRRGARQLNMTSERRLARSDLGRLAVKHALGQCLLASGTSLLGALLPLLLASAVPGPTWIAAVIAVLALGALGFGLATVVLGSRAKWTASLLVGGTAVTIIGAWINIAR